MSSDLILLVTCDVQPGAEERLNRWYDEVHLPEILACPGFISATRYQSLDGTPRFVAIYQIDREDVLSTPQLEAVSGWGPMAADLIHSNGSVHRRIFSLPSGD